MRQREVFRLHDPAQCIAVVSGKGGTGKTSFVAGVGAALAQSGHRTLCLDCDVALRNLDLALGLSDRALMDFTDVAQSRCTLDDAIVEHPRIPGLFLLTAPARLSRQPVTETQMSTMLDAVRRQFDYCLLDAPAGLESGFRLATCRADRVVVVTTSEASALRDAQHTVMELDHFPIGTLHLVVNRVRSRLLQHMHATIDDAIDTAGLPLLGVVPEDEHLTLALNQGTPLLLAGSTPAASAYRNIAGRITGKKVPLMRIK
jgi:septum site-determining protein MinD